MSLQRFIQRHQNELTGLNGGLIGLSFIFQQFTSTQLLGTISLIVASIIGAVPIFLQAYQALRVKTISIELLVSIAVIGAFLIQEYHESAIVTFLFLFGHFLEKKTLDKTRNSIKKLTQLAPTTAWLIKAESTVEVGIDEVNQGDLLLVKTGSQIPVDGVIASGNGYANEASITGEALPVEKTVGDAVFAGSLLEDGTLQVTATRVGEDTTFGKIIELVEEAQDSKSGMEKFIDKFAKYYTPAVLIISVLTFVVTRDFSLAITLLVLGCPGALVIGVPVSNVAGIGNGARHGVLIKGGEVMDQLNQVDTFIFDKTGTLTNGTPKVTQVHEYTDKTAALAITAAIEKESNHPLAKAIVRYAPETNQSVDKTTVIKGQGIQALVSGKVVLIGNERLMIHSGIQLSDQQKQTVATIQQNGSSLVIVAIDHVVALIIGIEDTARSQVKESIIALRQLGVEQFIMLTGDNQKTGEHLGKQIGIDQVYADLLPEDKVNWVKKIQAKGHRVAFVGDGINDSPSIATADVGIAMGSGTDAAIETADVVLMNASFSTLVHAYGLTKKTVANMKENIAFALGTVLFLLIGLIFGYVYLASGMFVHEASILIVILNAMRLLSYHKKQKLDSNQLFTAHESVY